MTPYVTLDLNRALSRHLKGTDDPPTRDPEVFVIPFPMLKAGPHGESGARFTGGEKGPKIIDHSWRSSIHHSGTITRSSRAFLHCLLALLALLASGLIGSRVEGNQLPSRLEIDLGSSLTILWDRGHTPVLLVPVKNGDGWLSLAKRMSGTTATARRIHASNPKLKHPLRDRRVRIPLELLRADLRLRAAKRLFPTDSRVKMGYRHWILDPFSDDSESWEWLSLLYCGREKSREIRRANPEMAQKGLHRARIIHIPESLLLPVFRSLRPPAIPTPQPTQIPRPRPTLRPLPKTPTPTHKPVESRAAASSAPSGALEFGMDAQGSYALYRLRRGEALYSAVVVRFTGQLHAKQVNESAREIAKRSGIPDVTDIPIGHPVKIPLDLLLPRFLPPQDPRRLAWEKDQKELAGFLEIVHATDLSGVHIILDSGHGGKDTGAVVHGIWESTYVYDILCRVRQKLQAHTKATVWTTIEDTDRSFSIPKLDRLVQDRDQILLTRPRYGLQDPVTGVHLRWYLGNDIILNRIGKSTPRSKTVFISFHADSLHPSIRGAMIYVPARHLRPRSYQASSRDLRSRREFQNHPTVRLSEEFTSRAEASSRHMAAKIISTMKSHKLPVHPNAPIRGRILRGKRSWVPAVLRYSLAQNAILIETCNMANEEDRKNLLNHEWREAFAQAIVEGIANNFGER